MPRILVARAMAMSYLLVSLLQEAKRSA